MKVVHVITGLGDGGAEKSLYRFLEADRTADHAVISLTGGGKYAEEIQALGVDVHTVQLRRLSSWIPVLRLLRLLAALDADIMQGWMPHGCLAVTLARRVSPRSKIFWNMRASSYGRGFSSLPTRLIVNYLARMSSSVPRRIFVAGRTALKNHEEIGFDASKLIYLPNGYKAQNGGGGHKVAQRADLRANPRREVKIGVVARFHPQKDHTTLLKALGLVKEEVADFSVTLVGAGISGTNRALVREIRRAGLADHVELAGPVKDPTDFYRSLDLHIMTSAFGEGFPNVVAESMLEGVPNIVTNVGDAAEIVGEAGWVVPPNSPLRLAQAILDAFSQGRERLAVRGTAARARIATLYTVERTTNIYATEYRRKSIAIYPRYSVGGASSRVRMIQYLSHLEEHGWDIAVRPFFDAQYLSKLYAGELRAKSIVFAYVRRISEIGKSKRADVVWVEKEILPWLPFLVEKIVFRLGERIVYDFDDALHEQYRQHASRLIRTLLGSKVARIACRADAVIVGNRSLVEFFAETASNRLFHVPSVVDQRTTYDLQLRLSPGPKKFVFGWIGTPVTWNSYVVRLLPLFQQIAQKLGAEFWVIGSGESVGGPGSVRYLDWSHENENHLLNGLDVGIMPLEDDPWSRGKCGYKLLQYMAVGIPVLASPVGANLDIVRHGVTGYLVAKDTDWEYFLAKLAFGPGQARPLGLNALRLVTESYSLESSKPKVYRILDGTNLPANA